MREFYETAGRNNFPVSHTMHNGEVSVSAWNCWFRCDDTQEDVSPSFDFSIRLPYMEKSSSLMDVSYQQMRVCVYNCESCFACAEQLTFVCSRQTRTWQQQQQLLCALPLIFCALRSTKRPPPPLLEVENSTRPTFHASIARMAHSTLWTYPERFSKEHWHQMENVFYMCVVSNHKKPICHERLKMCDASAIWLSKPSIIFF